MPYSPRSRCTINQYLSEVCRDNGRPMATETETVSKTERASGGGWRIWLEQAGAFTRRNLQEVRNSGIMLLWVLAFPAIMYSLQTVQGPERLPRPMRARPSESASSGRCSSVSSSSETSSRPTSRTGATSPIDRCLSRRRPTDRPNDRRARPRGGRVHRDAGRRAGHRRVLRSPRSRINTDRPSRRRADPA